MKKYALITGASSGIGEEFARQLFKEGYSLILVARRRERLESIKESLVKKNNKKQEIIIVTADLEKKKDILKVYKTISDLRISIFINNAGFGDCGQFLETDLEKEMSMINVNIKAMHRMMKLLLRKMQAQRYGYILNVASSAGLMPGGPYMATYYASKAYVTSLTRSVATELKKQKSPVYLGALCPGPVNTEFNNVANVEFSINGITPKQCVECAIRGMKKKKIIIIPTLYMQIVSLGARLVPIPILLKICAYFQKKKLG